MAKKKKATKKKATKKKATKKKATKKKVAKKKATKKKAKKKATKKKVAKKKATKKKATKKKATKKKAAKKATKKKATKKKAAKKKKTKTKRKPNPAFMRPLSLSTALADVIGSKDIPRTEVVKKIWQYIKKHDLQDPKNRRNINADAKLKVVFGGKKTVSMFEMTKLLSKHLK